MRTPWGSGNLPARSANGPPWAGPDSPFPGGNWSAAPFRLGIIDKTGTDMQPFFSPDPKSRAAGDGTISRRPDVVFDSKQRLSYMFNDA